MLEKRRTVLAILTNGETQKVEPSPSGELWEKKGEQASIQQNKIYTKWPKMPFFAYLTPPLLGIKSVESSSVKII